jgi:hypothetical protein
LVIVPVVAPSRLPARVVRPAVAVRAGVLVGLFVLYAALAAVLPPVDDELYYWCWAQKLQLSYYDHPPMVAYLIRLATSLFGNTVFALRLPAVVASVVAFGVVAELMKWKRFLWAAVLTPLFTFGAILVTPDTPLILFWSLYLLWLSKLHSRLQTGGRITPGFWALGGIALGCGVMGKYTMALAVPAGTVSLLLVRPWRRWLAGYVAHGAVAFLVALPILIFNIQQDFVPLRYQWGHATAAGESGLKSFGEFLGIQALGFGFLPLVLFPWVLWRFRTLAADPILRVCACLYVVPFAIFVYKSLRGPLEGNWAIVAYLGFWPVAAAWYDAVRGTKWLRWYAVAACAPPAVCVAFVAVHLVHPWPFVPPRPDRITRQFDRIEAIRKCADAIRAHGEPIPVFVPLYQNVSALRFFGIDARQIDGFSRPSHFTRPPERPQEHDRVYIFAEALSPEMIAGFGPPEPIAQVPLVVRGEAMTVYCVWLLKKLPVP